MTWSEICDLLRLANSLGGIVLVGIMLSRHRGWARLPVWLRFYANGLMMMVVAAIFGSFEAFLTDAPPAMRVPVTTLALVWVAVGVLIPRDHEPYADRKRQRGEDRAD